MAKSLIEVIHGTPVSVRLQKGLHINVAGVARALDLLEEIDDLRNKVS